MSLFWIYFIAISSFINGIAGIILALLTWFNNPKKKVNKLMALMCVSIAFWGLSWGIQSFINEKSLALIWARVLNFAAIFIPIFLFHWVLCLLGEEKEKKNRIILIFGYLFTLFFAFFSFTSYFIKTVEPKLYFFYYSEPGILHPFYILLCYGGLIGYSLYRLLSFYRKAVDYKKTQIKYVFLGIILGFGGGATNYFLFYNISIPPFGNPLVAVGFAILSYSIIRYRLMDIRWVLGRTGIHFLSYLTVLFYTFSLFYFNRKLGLIIPEAGFIVLISITAVLFFLYFFRFYEKIASRYFYYTFYSLQQSIQKLEKRLNQTIELDKLITLINHSLFQALKVDKVGVALKQSGEKIIKPKKLINFREKDISFLLAAEHGFLAEYLQKIKKPLIREEIPFIIEEIEMEEEKKNLKKERTKTAETRAKLDFLKNAMAKEEVGLFLPLFIETKLIGLIILGNKVSRGAYTVQDINLLSHFSSHLSIAFNNSLAYEEIKKRKADLEKFYKLSVGRELRMVELKGRIKQLEKKLGEKN